MSSMRGDIVWSRQIGANRAGQLALWTAALMLAFAAHGAAAWWLMRQPSVPAADGGAPTAIMIDLAPFAMAPAAPVDQVAPDEVDSLAAEAPPSSQAEPADAVESGLAEPVTSDAQAAEEMTETAQILEATPAEPLESNEAAEAESQPVEAVPAEDVAEVEREAIEPVEEPVDPVTEMVTAELDRVIVPTPTARPDPPPRPQPQLQQPQPRQQRPQPAPQAAPSQQQTRAQAQTPQEAPRAAAPQSSSSVAPSVSPARWQSQLMAHLERRKRYPAAARRQRQEGTAQVRFTIDQSGNVQSVSLAASSGVPALDEEVLAMVRRASPVPAPPPGVATTITAPVRFTLR